MSPLGLLNPGEKAEIVEVLSKKHREEFNSAGDPKNLYRRAEAMGLWVGKTVEMLNNEGRGPILVKIDEFRVGIGRGAAMRIMVKKQ